MVLTAPDSIAWLLNVRGGDVPFTPLALSFAILYADASAELFIDGRKLAPGTADHLGGDVKTLEPDAFGPALDRLGKDAKTVRVSADTAPLWVFDRLEKAGAVIDRGDILVSQDLNPLAHESLGNAILLQCVLRPARHFHERRDEQHLVPFLAKFLGDDAAHIVVVVVKHHHRTLDVNAILKVVGRINGGALRIRDIGQIAM